MKFKLEDYTSWSRKRKRYESGYVTPNFFEGHNRIPEEVVESILKDAASGKVRTMAELAARNGVSPITAKRYLTERDVAFIKPRQGRTTPIKDAAP